MLLAYLSFFAFSFSPPMLRVERKVLFVTSFSSPKGVRKAGRLTCRSNEGPAEKAGEEKSGSMFSLISVNPLAI